MNFHNNTALDTGVVAGVENTQTSLNQANLADVSEFNQHMSGDSIGCHKSESAASSNTDKGDDVDATLSSDTTEQIQELLEELISLISALQGEGDTTDGQVGGNAVADTESLTPVVSNLDNSQASIAQTFANAVEDVDGLDLNVTNAATGQANTVQNAVADASVGQANIAQANVVPQTANTAQANGVFDPTRIPTPEGSNIPKPTELFQSFNLGNKEVAIGGDGTASAAEVQAAKDTITDLYAESPTFKDMLDSSTNDYFEVSVGKRDGDMSWGNEDGRVFMNLNSIEPGDGERYQQLTAHEFAHAAVAADHGDELLAFEQQVAREV